MGRTGQRAAVVPRHLALFACALLVAACGKDPAPSVTPSSRVDASASPRVDASASPAPKSVCSKLGTSSPGPSPAAITFTVVPLATSAPVPLQLAVRACEGLQNRKASGSAYVEQDPHDAVWLDELSLHPTATVGTSDFLSACVAAIPRCVRYDYATQQALLPNIVTVAAALGAVPLDSSLNVACGTVAFDAIQEFATNNTPALATQYVWNKYGKETTGLAMLDPGYDQTSTNHDDPPLTGEMNTALVDYVFSEKLFVLFLNDGCVDGTSENAVLSSIVNAGRWATPLGVYGYNDSWNVLGGDLYEAETLCLDSRNMGEIASETGNLSFFSTRASPITAVDVVKQSAPEAISYDPGTTYVAFIVGDGDNIGDIMTTRHDWFRERLTDCQSGGAGCPTLTWSISPHLLQVAPDLLRWYYEESHKTGKDYFALPPSGHLYAYPSSLAAADQDRFVTATQDDACLLGITGTVHWDWSGSWHVAEDEFLPKYASADGVVRGVFPVNVPYALPTFTWWPADRFYEIITGEGGGKLALFKPREWRGVDNDASPYLLSPAKMADELASYPKGTVTGIYMTSDGGLTLENSFVPLGKILPPHVALVSADTAAKLAIAAGQTH